MLPHLTVLAPFFPANTPSSFSAFLSIQSVCIFNKKDWQVLVKKMGKRALLKESCYLSALTGTRQFTRGKQLNAQLHEEFFGLIIFFLAHRVELKLEKKLGL